MVLLMGGEQILQQESARFVSHDDVRGLLILTNYRLVFEVHQARILHHSHDQTILNLGLEKVHNVHVSSPLIKLPLIGREVLRVETPNGQREFAVSNPSAWRDHIAHVRRGFTPQAFQHPHAPPAPAPVVVNVMQAPPPPPQAYMPVPPPPPPPPQIMVRCRYCNTVFPELSARCPSCGGRF